MLALVLLFIIVVAVPLLRLVVSGAIYAYAAATGRHHLRATAARVMPRIGHLLGSLVVGVASVAAPAMAAPEPDVTAISVDRDGGTVVAQSDTTPPPTSAPVHRDVESTAAPETVATAPQLYVVKTGDTLWDIAASQLDAPTNAEVTETWKAIWRANRQVIGDHPEHIRPGMELSLDGAGA